MLFCLSNLCFVGYFYVSARAEMLKRLQDRQSPYEAFS